MATYEAACRSRGLEPFIYIREQLQAAQAAGAPVELDCRGNTVPIQVSGRRLGAADLAAVFEALVTTRTRLVALHAGYNTFGDDAAAVLADFLPSQPLETLDVVYCDISGAAASALVLQLASSCPTLQTLVLDGNAIGDVGGAAVAVLVQSHASLRHLSVARCDLGIDSLIRLAGALASPQCCLAHLDISEPRLFSRNEESVFHVAKALRLNRSLRSLAMRKHPHLTFSGVESLCDCLQDNDGCLATLDLACNTGIAGPGGAVLARTLGAGATGLRALRLSQCRVGDEGAAALAGVLMRGAALDELDLRRNDIGDVGLAALAEVLASVPAVATAGGDGGGEGDGEGAFSSPLGTLLLAGNNMPAGAAGTTAIGNVLLARASTTALDLKAYVVDGEVHVVEQL